MSDELDRNIKKLLERAPRPEDPRPGAKGEIFSRVAGRLREERGHQRRGGRLAWLGAVAAAVAAAAAIMFVVWRPGDNTGAGDDLRPTPRDGVAVVRKLEPAVGAAVSEQLCDGSRIEVAGGSRVRVTSWPKRSRPLVELFAGEVTCEVAPGKGQFKVVTPVGEAIALGTKFIVRLENQSDAESGEVDDAGGQDKVRANRKAITALVMTVVVLSGEVLVRERSGAEQLAAAGETVKIGKAKVKVADFEKWSSGALVARLEDGSQGKPLEVRKHGVTVTIKEQIALVEVDQTFYNDTNRRMEGVFYFPLPAGATICRLAMYVGDRLMEGEIAETQRARRTFEALLVQQRDPALLEWAGGNMFKMRVFPIEAKSEKRVLLSYYQVLKREHGRIRFTYPLVSDALQTHPVGEIDLKVTVASTPKILSASAAGNKTAEVKSDAGSITASLNIKKAAPKADFVLDYRVAKGDGQLVVVPYWHSRDGEGYFLMIFSPELEEVDSEKPTSSRFVFVIDKSGGLGDRHLALARKSVKHALSLLKLGDEFGIVAYDTFASSFKAGLVKASDENKLAAGKWLDGLESMGASDLSAAWKATAKLAGTEPAQIVYVGSGLSSLTSTKTARLVADAEKALKGTDIRLHCIAMGDVQDAEFLAELARKFDGTVRPVASADDVSLNVGELMDDYSWPLYTGVRMEFLGVETSEIYPVWFPNVSAGRQLFAFGKFSRQGKARVRLSAAYKDKPYNKEFEISLDGERSNNFVARLWANQKIRHLQDVAALADGQKAGDLAQTVIRTSKRYRVMSQYTSFIVLETAEDYERFGIERRANEFGDSDDENGLIKGDMGGAGGGQGADFWKQDKLRNLGENKKGKSVKRRGGKAGNRDRARGRKSYASEKEEVTNSPGRDPRSAPPAPSAKMADAKPGRGGRTKGASEELGARRKKLKELQKNIDVLSWARQDIFPVFGSNELGRVPHRHKHSRAEAMKILEAIGKRYGSLAMKVAAYRLGADGKEVLEGREWQVVIDPGKRRFYSRKLGDDHFDVSDGKVRVRYFPLLKYAAKRRVTGADLRVLAAALPGYIFPWAQKLDRRWYISVQKSGEEGVVIKLARRGQKHNYVLLHLKSANGPVTRIEVFERTGRYRHYTSRKAQTIECTGIKKVGGVEIATVFKITYHSRSTSRKIHPKELEKFKAMVEMLRKSGNLAKAEELERKLKAMQARSTGTVKIVRIKDVKVNHKPKADEFSVKVPKDWAVRDLDASPRGKDVRPVSRPVNPSNLVR
jgi:Vault protein inter-alpha-trypsin domain/von Willebrand factor type A domain/FecR protein